jgi:hypothetical protein
VKTPLIAERGMFGRKAPGISSSAADRLFDRSGLADEVISALEARAMWARYGL